MNDPRPLGRDLAATAALTLYSCAVAVGFARVFSGWEFLAGLVVLAVVGHGVSFALRRVGASGWVAIPFLLVSQVWLIVVQRYRDTTSWLIPTAETWDRVGLEIGLVRDQFPTAVAPVIHDAGWATLAGVAVAATVVLADSFAFRAEGRGEALVPGGVLFVFIAALASDRLRIVSSGLLVAAGVLAAAALRGLHDRGRRVELRPARRVVSLAGPAAMSTAAVVAVLAGVLGPRLPGADAEPLYDTRGRSGGITNIVSPLVDIRSRLTNRGDTELFRVNADQPAYWRVTTLAAFDGQRFSLPERRLERIEGGDVGTTDGTVEIRQQIQVLALDGVLVPAAADPVGAEGFSGGVALDLRLNRDTSSLIAPDDLSPGDLFRVASVRPALTPDVLRSATVAAPPDAIFTELPDDLPAVVDEFARAVTAGTATPYDAAISLQSWFRDPDEFSYSLEVQAGHGSNAIESFFDTRVGYCEQFAATFATMARALGIPSRVAVGFTPGSLDAQGWYTVLGKNAHAWPELWFDGIGWVAFEPTPGRGAPGAESYTGLDADQDDSGPATTPTQPTSTTIAPPVTTVPSATGPTTTTPTGPVLPSDGGGSSPDPADTPALPSGGAVPWRLVIGIATALLALALPEVVRRARARHDRSGDLTARVHASWRRAVRAVEGAGVPGRASMTAHEWVAAAAERLPVAARPMAALADVVDQVTFGPPGRVDLERLGSYGTTLGRDCEIWAGQIAKVAVDTLGTGERLRRYFTDWR